MKMKMYKDAWRLYSTGGATINTLKRKRFSKEIAILNQYQSILLKSIGVPDTSITAAPEQSAGVNYQEYINVLLSSLKKGREGLLRAFGIIGDIEGDLGASELYFYELVGKFIHDHITKQDNKLTDRDALNIYLSIKIVAMHIAKIKESLEKQNREIGPDTAVQILKKVIGSDFELFRSKIPNIEQKSEEDINLYKKIYEEVFVRFLKYAEALHKGIISKLEDNKSSIETIMREQERGYYEAIEIAIHRYTIEEDQYNIDDLSELERDILGYLIEQSNHENFRHYLDKLLHKHYEESETPSSLLPKFIDLAFTSIYDNDQNQESNIPIKEIVDASNIYEAFVRSMEAIEHTLIMKIDQNNDEIKHRIKEKIDNFNKIGETIISKFVEAFENKAVALWDILKLLKDKISFLKNPEIDLKNIVKIYILKLSQEYVLSMEYQKSRVGKARNEEITQKMKKKSDILIKLIKYIASSNFSKPETPEREKQKILEALKQINEYDEKAIAELLREINTIISNSFKDYITKLVGEHKTQELYGPRLSELLELRLYSELEDEGEYVKDIIEKHYPMLKYIIIKDILYQIGSIAGTKFRDFLILANQINQNDTEIYTRVSYKDSLLKMYEMLLKISNEYAITIKSILKSIVDKIFVKNKVIKYGSLGNKVVINSYHGEDAIDKTLEIAQLLISSFTEFYVDLLDYFYILFSTPEHLINFIKKINRWSARNPDANPYNSFTPTMWDTYPHVIEVKPSKNNDSEPEYYIIDPCLIFYMSMRLHDYIIREAANFYEDNSLHELIYEKSIINPKGRKSQYQDSTTAYLGIVGYTSEAFGEIALKYGNNIIYQNIIYGQVPNGIKSKLNKYIEEKGNNDFSSFYFYLKSLKIRRSISLYSK